VQSTGKVLAAGHAVYASSTDSVAYICRFKANRLSLDSTFGFNGIIYAGIPTATPANINAIMVGPDDKIYYQFKKVGGTSTYLKALNADGSDYAAFGTAAEVSTGTTRFNKMKMIGGKLICGLQGAPGSDVIWSYNADGTADTSFHSGTNALNLGSYVSGGSNFVVNDISSNAAGDILVVGRFDNATPKREGLAVKLTKKLRPTEPSVVVIGTNTTAMQLYPNPASNLLHIDVPFDGEAQVRIASVSGGTVLSQNFVANQPISIEALAPGMYFVNLSTSSGSYIARFVKQ
jgi:hypothetical protein